MSWIVGFSLHADKFLRKNNLNKEEVFELVGLTVKKFKGETANIDIKKLKGKWLGFYRIKRGDLRIIASFDFDNYRVLVEEIDWRGNAYKE